MSNLQQFFGEPAVKSIVNGQSAGGKYTVYGTFSTFAYTTEIKSVLSGALTANTLSTVLSITGSGGYLDIVGSCNAEATSRTHRFKITLDGVVVFDATSLAVATDTAGMLAVGSTKYEAAGSCKPTTAPQRFNSSCLVEYASNNTETDKSYLFYAYRTTN